MKKFILKLYAVTNLTLCVFYPLTGAAGAAFGKKAGGAVRFFFSHVVPDTHHQSKKQPKKQTKSLMFDLNFNLITISRPPQLVSKEQRAPEELALDVVNQADSIKRLIKELVHSLAYFLLAKFAWSSERSVHKMVL